MRGHRCQPLDDDAARLPRLARHREGHRERQLRRQGLDSTELKLARVRA